MKAAARGAASQSSAVTLVRGESGLRSGSRASPVPEPAGSVHVPRLSHAQNEGHNDFLFLSSACRLS